jgi:enoyl-[acyl-carrier-protein] reductase (NADH)
VPVAARSGFAIRQATGTHTRFDGSADTGEAAVFLASSAGAFITGEVWHVDGGATIMGG